MKNLTHLKRKFKKLHNKVEALQELRTREKRVGLLTQIQSLKKEKLRLKDEIHRLDVEENKHTA